MVLDCRVTSEIRWNFWEGPMFVLLEERDARDF